MILEERISVARGEQQAALVLKNAKIFHLTNGEFETADIAIASDGMICGVGQDYQGLREIDAAGLTAVPGFIDSHVHLESSLMTPDEYEKCVVRHGVTTAVSDPHELANVVGPAAFDYYLAAAKGMTMDLIVRLSSCVPATDLETSGAAITAADLQELHRRHPEMQLAEFMNVPGVLFKVPEILAKLREFSFIDGHCPMLGGKDLNAYIAAGIRNCHECSLLSEAQEKLRRGMQVLIREGTAARNLDELMPLLTLENSPFLAFCTDDRNPLDMIENGHIDKMIARAIAKGVSPLVAYRVASWSAARSLELPDRGLIAPGQRADIVLLSDLATCAIERVIVHGRPSDEIAFDSQFMPEDDSFRRTVRCRAVTAEDFKGEATGVQPVMGAIDGSLITDYLHLDVASDEVQKVAVIERHGKSGAIANAFVRGFGLKRGALASSVGHDSHNLCVVGTNAEDMAVAVNALRGCQGGFAVACEGQVTGLLPLPLAGLFSDLPSERLVKRLKELRKAAAALGCTMREPFLQLAFLPLPVIPHLKLTDKGLVDADAFKLI